MTTYSVAEAKNQLPKLIDRALQGEEVVITRRGKPVVELRAASEKSRPPIGTDEWLFERRVRPGVGITSVELLDLLNEADQDEHIFGRQLGDTDARRGSRKRRR
ncbi:MAG TPA: type II toxin-antitoxin system prevent-host-death family antitoxin [Stellaceae bacterium]